MRERISTGKEGKDLREVKGEDLRGGSALGGKGEKGSQQGKVGEDLREENKEDLGGEKALRSQGGEGLRGERGERI